MSDSITETEPRTLGTSPAPMMATPITAAPMTAAPATVAPIRAPQTASALTLQNLRALLTGEILALHIPGFRHPDDAQQLTQNLIDHAQFERYFRAPDIGVQRTGMTFFETNGSDDLLLRYYEESLLGTRALREACSPRLSPVDQLRLELGDLWLEGLRNENAHGRPMLAGIGRVFENGFELPPHQDILARDLRDATQPPLANHQPLLRQFSANIYLRPATQGGELEIWDRTPSSQEQEGLRDREFQYEGIIARTALPAPTVVIDPQPGDLILFDSSCIHAVRASQGGPRVSMSLFIGYRGPNQPLTYWN